MNLEQLKTRLKLEHTEVEALRQMYARRLKKRTPTRQWDKSQLDFCEGRLCEIESIAELLDFDLAE